jgi:CO dehydrogenase maturation factor
MTRLVSFSGKGGSGKTTTASLVLASALRRGLFRDILVIDADPDANLSQTLDIQVNRTLGQVLDQRVMELDEPGGGGTKLRFSVWDTLSHGEGFDFLVMGRTTGQGCYCPVNSVLNRVMEETASMYDLVLIDFDAGIEHFSRRAGNPGDTLVITCDPSRLSFETAKRIKSLVEELSLPYDRQYMVGCRFDPDQEEIFMRLTEQTGIEHFGIIPCDPEIAARNLSGEGLLSLDSNNPSLKKAGELLTRIVSQI